MQIFTILKTLSLIIQIKLFNLWKINKKINKQEKLFSREMVSVILPSVIIICRHCVCVHIYTFYEQEYTSCIYYDVSFPLVKYQPRTVRSLVRAAIINIFVPMNGDGAAQWGRVSSPRAWAAVRCRRHDNRARSSIFLRLRSADLTALVPADPGPRR